MDKQTAVLIVDVQLGMFESPIIPSVCGGNELLTRISSLLSKARTAQLPIFFIQHNGGKGHPLEPGTAGWPIHPAIMPTERDVVIQKLTSDSFKDTQLHQQLQTLGVGRLIVAGIQTEFCVDTTCRRGFSLEYDVTLVSDAHSTWDTEVLSADQIIAHHNKTLGDTFVTLKKEHEIRFTV
ncbi:MAG: cysteine hydrolase family protein [Bacteroidota bacterium]